MDRFLTVSLLLLRTLLRGLRFMAAREYGQFVLVSVMSVLLVVGCTSNNRKISGGNDNAKSLKGNNPFYEVYGERYYVLSSSKGYSEKGIASWYGKKFHGKLTSNGETYNMYDMTAAHKTLPLPSTVKVTNLRNGRSVIVRVNDRGPFVDDRLIDMSYAAAKKLDMIQSGTTRVKVESLDKHSRNEPVRYDADAAEFGTIFMQVGAFGDKANAIRLADKVSAAGVDDVTVYSQNGFFKVRVGPVKDIQAYDALVVKMNNLNLGKPHLVVEPD